MKSPARKTKKRSWKQVATNYCCSNNCPKPTAQQTDRQIGKLASIDRCCVCVHTESKCTERRLAKETSASAVDVVVVANCRAIEKKTISEKENCVPRPLGRRARKCKVLTRQLAPQHKVHTMCSGSGGRNERWAVCKSKSSSGGNNTKKWKHKMKKTFSSFLLLLKKAEEVSIKRTQTRKVYVQCISRKLALSAVASDR